MTDEEINTAIKLGSVIVYCNTYQHTFFVPLHKLPNNYIEAKPQLNSRYLRNGHFEFFGCNVANCRMATVEETALFYQLKASSSHFRNVNI